MKISSVSVNNSFVARAALKGAIYATPVKNGAVQEGILKSAIDELEKVEYDKNDIAYMKSMGINPPFESGHEAVKFLKDKKIPVQYGKFSDKKVHACLAKGDDGNEVVLINERYKNSTSRAEVLATSEAINHEIGHAKDGDRKNSIQEELDNLSLNVLVHRAYEKKYKGIFDDSDTFFFREGVKLYPKLFYAYGADKTDLKNRVADKYGHLPAGDEKHPASKIANEIKELDTVV